ncbi:hypothetical protein M8J77_005422 [Diaphorina citri]|nr:hypothetical protein M8J77_005422 [Diaphorina citri]
MPRLGLSPRPPVYQNSLSNSSQVVLRDIGLNLSGLMRCEVTADAPTYKTSLANKTMTVVDSLPGKIKFWSEQSFYKAGDMLIASCTSPPSRPPSVLTFLINNKTEFLPTHYNACLCSLCPYDIQFNSEGTCFIFHIICIEKVLSGQNVPRV